MRFPLRFIIPVLAALTLAVGCSDDDNPTDPGNGGGGGGGGNQGVSAFGAIMASINNDYIAPNEEGYTSLETMGPFIAASLSMQGPPISPQASALGPTCFSAIEGTTYYFNGTTYEAGPAMSAPPNTVRYVLYRISGEQPVLSDSIGYFEVSCTVVNTTSRNVALTLVVNGLSAFAVSGVATDNSGVVGSNVNGVLAAPGVPTLSLAHFSQLALERFQLSTTITRNDLQLQFGTVDSLANGKREVGAAGIFFPELNWNIIFRLHGETASGAVETGGIYYSDINTFGITQLKACINGETFDSPTYAAPSEGCNELGADVGPAFSSADLATATTGYLVLKMIHDFFSEIAIVAFGLPAPS